MKRQFLLTAIFLTVLCALSAQNKPLLAILPFTGGTGGDGETIAELFSFEPEIDRVFTRIPRTSSIEAIIREQQFQRSTGLTDSDTIARIGRQLNADYVAAGHIYTLGNSKLVLITIIHVESLQQIAGDYKEYKNIDDMVKLVTPMAKRIADTASITRLNISNLAIFPFSIPASGVNQDEAVILAQILATEVANTGRYAVLPRTSTIETVMKEHNIQRSGITETENIKKLGTALNAQHVLSGNIRRLGQTNIFTAQILDVENGQLVYGAREDYSSINDGLTKMAALSDKIIGNKLFFSGSAYYHDELLDGNHKISNENVQGEIRNGHLNLRIDIPSIASLSLLTIDEIRQLDLNMFLPFRSYDVITLSNNGIRFYFFSSIVWTTNYTSYTLVKENFQIITSFYNYPTVSTDNFEYVASAYIYVSDDVVITASGRFVANNYINIGSEYVRKAGGGWNNGFNYSNINLELKKGWNSIFAVRISNSEYKEIFNHVFIGTPENILWRVYTNGL